MALPLSGVSRLETSNADVVVVCMIMFFLTIGVRCYATRVVIIIMVMVVLHSSFGLFSGSCARRASLG